MDYDFLIEDEKREAHIKKLIEEMERQKPLVQEDIHEDLESDNPYCRALQDSGLEDVCDKFEEALEDFFNEISKEVEIEEQDEDEDEDLFLYEIYGSYIAPDHP